MDSIESPSKSYQSSFGLLDDNLINDASFNGDKSNEQQLKTNTKPPVLSNIINNKEFNKQSQKLPPPAPQSKVQQPLKQQQKCDENDLNEENVDTGEMTVENVVINDSELSELENEFSTFSDEDEENDENKQQLEQDEQRASAEAQQQQLEAPLTRLIDMFSYKPDKPLLNRDLSCIHEENDLLIDSEKYSKFFTTEQNDHQSNLLENESSQILENEKDSTLIVDQSTQNKLCETPTAGDNRKSSLSFTSSINGFNSDGLSQYSTEKAKHQPYSIHDEMQQLNPTQLFNTKSQAFHLSSFNLSNTDRLANTSMFDSSKQDNEPRLTLSSSLYFKPSNDFFLNNDSMKADQEEQSTTANNTTASTLKQIGGINPIVNQTANDTANLYDNFGFGVDAQKEFFAQENINFSCDFKSGEELLNEPEMIVEQHFYNNTSSDGSGSDQSKQAEDPSWWHIHSQQPSKLDLSNLTSTNASLNYDNKISVDHYFTRKSSIPKYLDEQEQKSLLNLTKEFNNDNSLTKPSYLPQRSNENVEECTKKSSPEQQNQHYWNEKTTFNDFTLSNIPSGFCENSGFSFTFNANDTGDFLQKVDKNMKKSESSQKYQANNEKNESISFNN